MKTPPEIRGRFDFGDAAVAGRSGRLLLGHLRLLRLDAGDLDGPRLHRLRYLAHQVDMQQAVVEARAGHLDVVGEAEAPLERAPGNAAVQIAAVLILFLRLAGDE